MDSDTVSALLGRSLTSYEEDNFDLYLEIATDNLQSLLCMSLFVQGEDPSPESRLYMAREGYRTLYVDPFTYLDSITVNGEVKEVSYSQYENYGGTWYNAIAFDEPMGTSADNTIEVTATWGFPELPASLKFLLAQMFGVVTKKQTSRVKSKSNEGFSVTYADDSAFQQYVLDNASLINKYRMCDRLTIILHGDTYKDGREYSGLFSY